MHWARLQGSWEIQKFKNWVQAQEIQEFLQEVFDQEEAIHEIQGAKIRYEAKSENSVQAVRGWNLGTQ